MPIYPGVHCVASSQSGSSVYAGAGFLNIVRLNIIHYTLHVGISIACQLMIHAKASPLMVPLCAYNAAHKCTQQSIYNSTHFPSVATNTLESKPNRTNAEMAVLFPRIYTITPQRRAFLNLLRYLAGTWNGGDDSGYTPPREPSSNLIGAFSIYKQVYFEAGSELRIFPSYTTYYLRPEIQDQIALHLMAKQNILTRVDNASNNGSHMHELLKILQPVASISFSPLNDKDSQTVSYDEIAKFWRANLKHLLDMSKRPPSAPSQPWPDLILDDLVEQGIITSSRRTQIIDGSLNVQQPLAGHSIRRPPDSQVHERSVGNSQVLNRQGEGRKSHIKMLSEREAALLSKIRSGTTSNWRQYGKCIYDWGNWKLLNGDIRSTTASCAEARTWTVGVSCNRLLVNIYNEQSGWQGWGNPAGPNHETRSGEDEMVAALCANITTTK
jgi:hypothetical protein